jgi:fatty acid desaturase
MPAQNGADLHRDKLGLADDADRRALRELRIVAPVALALAVAAWIAGAGPWVLLPALMLVFAFVQWRAALLRRKVRRDYRSGLTD